MISCCIMKTCTLCKQLQPISNFGKHAQKKDGLSSWCKLCANIKAKERMSTEKYKKRKQEYDKARYQNPEVQKKAKEKSRFHYNSDKDKWKQAVLHWQKNNADKVKSYKKNNKYKRREVLNSTNLTAKQLAEWETSQYKICSYCAKPCELDYQLDHIEPLSKNGTHSLDNLTISCPTCNQSKSNTPLLIWLAKTKTLRS